MNRRNGLVTMWLVANIVARTMFLVGIALMTAILLRRWHRYYRRRRRRERPQKSTVSRHSKSTVPIRSLSDAPNEVLRWEVELHDTARALMGELDSKMRVLQILIRQAKEESERLEGLLSGVNAAVDSQVQQPPSSQPPHQTNSPDHDGPDHNEPDPNGTRSA